MEKTIRDILLSLKLWVTRSSWIAILRFRTVLHWNDRSRLSVDRLRHDRAWLLKIWRRHGDVCDRDGCELEVNKAGGTLEDLREEKYEKIRRE